MTIHSEAVQHTFKDLSKLEADARRYGFRPPSLDETLDEYREALMAHVMAQA